MGRVQQEINSNNTKKSKQQNDNLSRGMAEIPHTEEHAGKVSEDLLKLYEFKSYETHQPTNTLKSVFVHPKDKKNIFLETSCQ